MPPTSINLTSYGLLKVSGVDAKKFLQGQLTCDLEKVTSEGFALGAHCTPQGRVISLFRLFKRDESYYLLLPRSMIDVSATALKKYILFYKAEIKDVSSDFDVTELINSTEHDWKIRNLCNNIPEIYPETSGKFLPHEINLPEINAVSFDKGCYTGQEIIARMHYRGKLKNHLYLVNINRKTLPLPGSPIFYLQNQEIKIGGTIVDSTQVGYNNYQALIVTDEKNAKNNHLFIDNDQNQFITILIR